MPRYYYLILLIITSSYVCGLPQLIISPSQGYCQSYMGYRQNCNLTLLNNGTTALYNLTIIISSDSQYFQFPVISNISSGVSYQTNISILTDSVFEKSYVGKFQYKYLIEDTYLPINYVINISSSGYQPSYLNIKRTDNVTYVNVDVTNHSVKEVGNNFNYLVEPSQNITIAYDSIGEVVYYDADYTGLIGRVNVSEESHEIYAHSSSLDVYWILAVKSQYATSDYSINLLNSNIDMTYDDIRQNVLEIINNRTFEIYGLRLSTEEPYQDWITYTVNNVNVSGLSSKLVNFLISPKVNKTSQTNMTYLIPMTIIPINANPSTINLRVFVQYHNFGSIDLGNTTVLITELSVDDTIAFCLARPDYANCEKLLYFCVLYPEYGKCKELYKERIIEVPASYNISGDKIEEMVMSVSKTDELMERQDNKYNIIQQDVASVATRQSGIESSFKALIQKVNDNERMQADNELKAKRTNVLRFVIGILLSLIVGIFMLLKFLAWRGTIYQQIRQSPGE